MTLFPFCHYDLMSMNPSDQETMVHYAPSSLWHLTPEALQRDLQQRIHDAVSPIAYPRLVFFRADDVAVPSRNFSHMIAAFKRRRVPLSMAVVPAWLTRNRWEALRSVAGDDPALWCWHQHGYQHKNHEPEGKKCEFGASRPTEAIRQDLRRGRDRLSEIMGPAFFPAFTPPWNRCGTSTLVLLKEMGYYVVSRSKGASSAPPRGLADFSVNVDLHTRKEPDPETARRNLLDELETALGGGFCGIMIHHQRMNGAALDFLDNLLSVLTREPGVRLVHMKDLIETDTP